MDCLTDRSELPGSWFLSRSCKGEWAPVYWRSVMDDSPATTVPYFGKNEKPPKWVYYKGEKLWLSEETTDQGAIEVAVAKELCESARISKKRYWEKCSLRRKELMTRPRMEKHHKTRQREAEAIMAILGGARSIAEVMAGQTHPWGSPTYAAAGLKKALQRAGVAPVPLHSRGGWETLAARLETAVLRQDIT